MGPTLAGLVWGLVVFVVLVLLGGLIGSMGTVELFVAATMAGLVGVVVASRRRRGRLG